MSRMRKVRVTKRAIRKGHGTCKLCGRHFKVGETVYTGCQGGKYFCAKCHSKLYFDDSTVSPMTITVYQILPNGSTIEVTEVV